MKFNETPIVDSNVPNLIRVIESGARELVNAAKAVAAIILLRELSRGSRVREFLTAYNGASYVEASDKGLALSLADAKEWAEALDKGKSALDGCPV